MIGIATAELQIAKQANTALEEQLCDMHMQVAMAEEIESHAHQLIAVADLSQVEEWRGVMKTHQTVMNELEVEATALRDTVDQFSSQLALAAAGADEAASIQVLLPVAHESEDCY